MNAVDRWCGLWVVRRMMADAIELTPGRPEARLRGPVCVQAVTAGYSQRLIGRALHLDRTTVRAHLRRHGGTTAQ